MQSSSIQYFITNQMMQKPGYSNLSIRGILSQSNKVIDDYFRTLSRNRMMLKAVDLYQLLQDILSHHFLYEFNTDHHPFFQKVNSFQAFMTITHKFMDSNQRELSNKAQNCQFIRRDELQMLIEYWSQENPQLTLLPSVRDNTECQSVQTQQIHLSSMETQANEPKMSLIQFINASITQFSQLSDESNKEEHAIALKICACLRKQKIELLSNKKQNTTAALSPIDKLAYLMVDNPFKSPHRSKGKVQPNKLHNTKEHPKASTHKPNLQP